VSRQSAHVVPSARASTYDFAARYPPRGEKVGEFGVVGMSSCAIVRGFSVTGQIGSPWHKPIRTLRHINDRLEHLGHHGKVDKRIEVEL
jgi:hypothetical protein